MAHYGYFKLWWLFITFLMAFFALFFIHFLWDIFSPLKCNIDQNCEDYNMCTNDFCQNSICHNELVEGATCSSSKQCDTGFDCIECQCIDLCTIANCTNPVCHSSSCFRGICSEPIFIPGCGGCQNDTNCIDDMDPCTTELCIDGSCFSKVILPNECSNTTSCTLFNQECIDCMCIDSCENITCNENPCIHEKCIDGMCMEIGDSIPNCCQLDEDCSSSMDNCTTPLCIDNFCHYNVVEPNECSTTTSCTLFNQECIDCLCIDSCLNITCNSNPCILEQCIDGECIQIGNGTLPNCCEDDEDCNDQLSCTDDICTNGECSHISIGDCVTNGDCPTNENCIDCFCEDLCLNVTCTSNACETKQCSHGQCNVIDVLQGCCFEDSQCPTLNQCFRGVCTIGNTCTQDLATNATCSYDNECDFGFYCDITTCGCIPLPQTECTEDSQCNDNSTCTSDFCAGILCKNIQQFGCCNNNTDCEDNNPCHTNFTCNNSTGLCSFEILDEDSDDVPCTIDCDDQDNTIGVAQRWYRDFDGDGDGNPNINQISCNQPIGFVNNSLDCNDNDATIFYQSQICNLTLINEALLVTPFQTQFNPIQFDFNDGTDFGRSVASFNDTVVIGAPGYELVLGEKVGVVFVFIRDGPLLPLQQILTPPIMIEDGQFGYSVDIYGDIIIVGSPGIPLNSTGVSYVFRRIGTVWSHIDTLTPSALNTTQFGRSVTINQNLTIGICANGFAYSFVQSIPFDWFQNAVEFSHLGYCTSIAVNAAGTIIIVGDPTASFEFAYVYFHGASSLLLIDTLQNSDHIAGDQFGATVAVDDNTQRIVVGAPTLDIDITFGTITIPSAGAAYLFYNQTSSVPWTQAQKFINNNIFNFDTCGTCVSIRNGTILMGCNQAGGIGKLNVYEESNAHQLSIGDMPNRFELAGNVRPYGIDSADTTVSFGSSCDVYDHELIGGAPLKNLDESTAVGAAYSVYCLTRITCPSQI